MDIDVERYLLRGLGRLRVATVLVILWSVIGIGASHTSQANATSSGLVCFSATANSCPSSQAQFSAPLGSTFTAYVVIQGSQAFNGFNIWFQYPYGVLNATSVSLLGSILPGASVQFKCINGQGSSGCGAWLGNGPGIVALAAGGNQTTNPVTGLLYSVTFQVTGNGSGSLGFFCVTNPSGPWLLNCAAVSNGSSIVSENVQDASFVTGPSNGNVNQNLTFDGVNAVLTGSLSASANSVSGTVSVTATNTTTGTVIFSKTFTISFTFVSSSNPRFVLVIPSSPYTLGTSCSINASSNQTSCNLSRDPDVGHRGGTVGVVDATMVGAAFNSLPGSSRFDPVLDVANQGSVNIIDIGIVDADFNAPVFT